MNEQTAFQHITTSILHLQTKKNKPLRVAINGIEGTGKTVFAQKLAHYLQTQSINACQVSIDGFHFNKAVRYQQGRDSAQGYYDDSYDEQAFVEKVLLASQLEPPTITTATHDLVSDAYLDLTPIAIAPSTVLITDGAYLFKPNYRPHWDLKIYLKTSFDIARQRGILRDQAALGGLEAAQEKYHKRYHKASQIYLNANQPETLADIILDNSDFEDLKLLKNVLGGKASN